MNVSAASREKAVISVRIVTMDYYMSTPLDGLDNSYSTYRGSEIKKVPIIRCFGSTNTGHKVCLHVHQVLPYFYIPYDGSLPQEQMSRQIAAMLDKSINVLQGQSSSLSHHIFKITFVQGIPLYGFHRKEHQFFKVYFYNPITRKRAYDLLMNGAILNKVLQPCEAHIPYILQFMIDFNLQGMNYIHLKAFLVRRVPANLEMLYMSSKIEPISSCEMEIDCFACDILNCLEVQDGVQMNPGLAALWDEEIERRKMKDMNADNIGPPASQPRLKVQPTSSHFAFKSQLEERLAQLNDEASLSFIEVNEQLETSLAIEVPDESERDKMLSASLIDFHEPCEAHAIKGDYEMLNILHELADEHKSFSISPSTSTMAGEIIGSHHSKASRTTVTTPLLDRTSSIDSIEDLPFDEDSILGTQNFKVLPSSNSRVTPSGYSSDTDEDEERETLEMTQVFLFEDLKDSPDMPTDGHCNPLIPRVSCTEMFEEQDTIMEDSLASSDTILNLPNVDGADSETSSEEEEFCFSSVKNKHERLIIDKSPHDISQPSLKESYLDNTKKATISLLGDSTTVFGTSPSNIRNNDNSVKTAIVNERTARISIDTDYTDALYTMGFFSPHPLPNFEFPQAETPVKIAQILIPSLHKDITAYQEKTGVKLKVSAFSTSEQFQNFESPRKRKYQCPTSNPIKQFVLQSKSDRKAANKSPFILQNQESVEMNIERSSNFFQHFLPNMDIELIQQSRSFLGQSSCKKSLPFDEEVQNVNGSTHENKEDKKSYFSSEDFIPHTDNEQKDEELDGEEQEFTPVSLSISNSGSNSPNLFPYSNSTLHTEINFNLFHDRNKSNDSDKLLIASLSIDGTVLQNISPLLVHCCQIFHAGMVYIPASASAPSRDQIISTMLRYNIDSTDNRIPFWSKPVDLVKLNEIKGKFPIIRSRLVSSLPDFGKELSNYGKISSEKVKLHTDNRQEIKLPSIICPLSDSPSRISVLKWLESQKNNGKRTIIAAVTSNSHSQEFVKQNLDERSELEMVSMNNSFGFRFSLGNFQEAKTVHQHQYLTILSLEIYISTRENLRPDPEFDAIDAVFYTISNDVPMESESANSVTGVILVESSNSEDLQNSLSQYGIVDIDKLEVKTVADESALFRHIVLLVTFWNPDILIGYEIEMNSWGYVLQRGTRIGFPIHDLLSRIPGTASEREISPEDPIEYNGYTAEKNSDIAILGRIVLNLWRLLRGEIALQSYTFENMMFHILHRRIPTFSFKQLTVWWSSNHNRFQVIEHYLNRVRGNIEMMIQLDLIGRTSELARLFGIQFFEVFTRGSQYRVESMMLRLAKPKNYIACSPSIQQRSQMKAPEWLPLIMEPESKYFKDPVIVLDFQSLYPSMIIAYNYCYSTCLGRSHLVGKSEPFEFGCTQLLIPVDLVRQLVSTDMVSISPAGVVFVKPSIRTGILPQMLREILDTRIMVKQSMKEYEGDNTLRRVFDSRQLGLKLIANVTYGYTAANFSGRMPSVEVSDSIVSKGRETLERAIHLIEGRSDWRARVIYGDTDSVFVLLKGRSREEAFSIGAKIADAVTETNPQPVKLKFEKVYQPCILQTKKRYCGYKYESVLQKDPVFEAKGIETVRRDGVPAVSKILERSLRILFDTNDVSKVKDYVQRQFSKILQNRNSPQDYIFAKEFRGLRGYSSTACVPALEITKQQMKSDPRAEARIGERLPYVVVYGSPGVPLIRLVVHAEQFLQDNSLRLNAVYYITRVIIPAVQRCMGLLGVDVFLWFQELPRLSHISIPSGEIGNMKKATISQYFGSSLCLLCGEPIVSCGLCALCAANKQTSAFMLNAMQRLREKDENELIELCRNCTGNFRIQHDCISLDCPVLYKRIRAINHLQLINYYREAMALL